MTTWLPSAHLPADAEGEPDKKAKPVHLEYNPGLGGEERTRNPVITVSSLKPRRTNQSAIAPFDRMPAKNATPVMNR